MGHSSYLTYCVGKGKAYPFGFKVDAVFAAEELGKKPAARKFKIALNTLKSWIREFKKNGKKGVIDKRKRPHFIPHKTPADEEERIVSIRKQAPCFGPLRIKYFYNLSCSVGAIFKYFQVHYH